LHALISFLFNTTFVALIINIIAGLIQKWINKRGCLSLKHMNPYSPLNIVLLR
jgi:hypothetical protein